MKLGELVDAQSGFASGDDLESGLFQIRMNNVTVDGALDLRRMRRVPRPTKRVEAMLLRPGDILFNATNSPELVGKSAYWPGLDEDAAFSNHFLRLRSGPRLDDRYLARWLTFQFGRGLFRRLCRQWVNQATVSRDALLALEIPLPPIEEQRRIAAILDKADEIRIKRRIALGELDALTQSSYLELFGDPRANPRGWPVTTLNGLGTLDRGVSKHRPRNDPKLLGGCHPLIQTGDVAKCDGYLNRWSSTYSDLGLAQSRMWPPGTLCITIAANIAKTGILTFSACFPDSVVGFTAPNSATTEYVRLWLSFIQKDIEDAAPESAQKNINLAVLRELRIPNPPLARKEQFATIVRSHQQLRHQFVLNAEESSRLFASLQDRAFRGEL